MRTRLLNQANRYRWSLIALMTAGITAASVAVPLPNSQVDRSSAEIFDPLDYATALCGRSSSDGYNARRKPFILAAQAYAATQPQTAIPDAPPLWPGLGTASMDISTSNPGAQMYFNQGLRLIYAFNHAEAIKSFQFAQEQDPECAMCYWGEAFSLGPNINAPMDPGAIRSAYQLSRKAKRLAAKGSDKEKALTAALVKRYSASRSGNRAALDRAFATAMSSVAKQFPDDDNIAALTAEAMMDTQAWDYWDSNLRPKGRTAEIMRLLETVLERNPRHPAAIHLYIHMTEASADPNKAESYAETLEKLMPGSGHLVHMPSHTYYRIGRFKDSIRTNIDAVEADEYFLASAEASPLYEFGYYTHNIHFVLTSAQMAGDADTALEMAAKLDSKLPIDMAAVAAWVQPIKAAPYFAYVQFAEPQLILGLEDPGAKIPYLQAMWHYARANAYIKLGKMGEAEDEIDAIADLRAEANWSALTDGGVPAKELLRIAELVSTARVAQLEGDDEMAIRQLEDAVALQDALPYTEPPYWYYPIRQTLGAALLKNGQPERAERVFFQALIDSPNNGWALYGLKQTYKQLGRGRSARYTNGLFKKAWIGDRDLVSLDIL